MERKDFIKGFLASGGIFLAAPTLLNSWSKDEGIDGDGGNSGGGGSTLVASVDLASPDYSALKITGNYAYKGNVIVFNTGGTYMAFSKICTHQNCTVKFDNGSTRIVCDCHGSIFSTTGAVVNGPAPTALKKYSVTVKGETLEIR